MPLDIPTDCGQQQCCMNYSASKALGSEPESTAKEGIAHHKHKQGKPERTDKINEVILLDESLATEPAIGVGRDLEFPSIQEYWKAGFSILPRVGELLLR